MSVSVLMPFRDAERTLPATLASLSAQSLAELEIIAVDDGSRDASAELVRAAFPAHRLRLLDGGRRGLVPALNLGLAHCGGELIARMDADDLAAPARLAAQAAYLESNTDVGIVASRVRCFADTGELGEGFKLYEDWQNSLLTHADITREIFIESPLVHPAVMYRRDAVTGLGGYRDAGWPEDYDLWLRAYLAGVRFAKLDEVLLEWRDHPRRATRVDARYARAAHVRCKAYFLARGPLAGRRRVVIWGAGPIGRALGRALTAEGVALAAFVDIDPRKVGRRRRDRPVIAPEDLAPLDPDFVIAAVGSRGARGLIRERLRAMGLEEPRDFLCAA